MPAAESIQEDLPESPGSDDPEPSSRPSGDSAPPPPDTIHVAIALHTDDTDPPLVGWLDDQLTKAAELSGVSAATLSLAVVDDEEMAQLHEQYAGVPGTTDVLTFDLADADSDTIEGDIIVCLDEAKRQATKRGHPIRHELLLYAVHGLLHLLGEDDHDQADYQRMHAREDALLEQLGFGRLFDLTPPPPNPNA